MKNKYLIAVVGPTAIGKTSLAIKLANTFKTEIISADSRQFYKEMQIGTAVPSLEELSQAKHHFIQHKSILESYNVGEFETDALHRLNSLYKKHDIIVMVGGSGLYLDAVNQGLDKFPKVDSTIRETLNQRVKNDGLQSLAEQLKNLDRITYDSIDTNNPHRVIRALEVCLSSDKPYSSFLEKPKAKRPFKNIKIGLTADRKIIYQRINQRVDMMIENGLFREAEYLFKFKDNNALNTVGYKELFRFLDEQCSLEFAISEIKKNTRRFAKRQLTWFRKDEDILWFDYRADINEIINAIEFRLKELEA